MGLFIVLFVVFVAIAIWSLIAARKRREALQKLAEQLGFQFMPNGFGTSGGFFSLGGGENERFLNRFNGIWPFGGGDRPDLENLLVGRRGETDWYAFDYRYETTSTDGEGKQRRDTHRFGVVVARIPVTLPALSLTPENVLHRIGAKLGYSELTFELEEFNRRYFIRSSDSKLAYDLLHPRTIDYLMRLPVREWHLGMFYVVVGKHGSYDPAEIFRVIEEIEGFVTLVPDYYRKDHAIARRWGSPLE